MPMIEVKNDKETGQVPIRRRRKNQKGPIPFAEMELGESFHVKKAWNMSNPSRYFASRVFRANQKYAPKRFVIRTVGSEDSRGPGCRIIRYQ